MSKYVWVFFAALLACWLIFIFFFVTGITKSELLVLGAIIVVLLSFIIAQLYYIIDVIKK